MESVYKQAVKFIVNNNLVEIFGDRCLQIVNDTTDMGWSFHDQLYATCHDYFDDQQA